MLQLHKLQLMLLLWLTPLITVAQVEDDFSDGNFTTSPIWLGDETKFIVNNSFQLQLNTTIGSPAYLATPASINNSSATEWRFWIKLGFSPSASNNARVYLSANEQNLTGPLNGYYLQLGEASATDKIELFRQDGTATVSICKGATLISKAFELSIKVIRDSAYNWQLLIDTAGAAHFIPEASGTDSAYTAGIYTGVVCNYTISNATKFYFDDFYVGPKIIDGKAPIVDSVVLNSPSQVLLYFNEAIDKTSALTPGSYIIDKGIGEPVQIILSTERCAILNFSTKLLNGQLYNLLIRNIKDLAGNTMLAASHPLHYYVTQPGDVVINEIMPDPYAGGVDFVEIYNRSDKVIALNTLYLCSLDTNKNILIQQSQISKAKLNLLPGAYLVLTANSAVVKQQYTIKNAGAFLDMNTIPPMNIDEDIIVIADSAQRIIDKLVYNKGMHFPLLSNTKGVSLERIDYNRLTADKTNWHSAAMQAGYATPGYKNSQYLQNEINNEISIAPEIFSPDNDGYNDVVTFGYNFNNSGNVGTINIYDSGGRMVKSLIRTELLGTAGTFSWDGITDSHEKANKGIYIFYMEIFDVRGNVKQFKKPFVLAIK